MKNKKFVFAVSLALLLCSCGGTTTSELSTTSKGGETTTVETTTSKETTIDTTVEVLKVPTIEVVDVLGGKRSVSFDLKIVDTDKAGKLTKLELYKNNVLVTEAKDLSVREFKGLDYAVEYEIKATYTYNIKDGKGEVALIASAKATTGEKPTLTINNKETKLALYNHLTLDYTLSNEYEDKISFKSSDGNVLSVDENGVVYAKNVGSANVVCSSVEDTTISASLSLEVVNTFINTAPDTTIYDSTVNNDYTHLLDAKPYMETSTINADNPYAEALFNVKGVEWYAKATLAVKTSSFDWNVMSIGNRIPDLAGSKQELSFRGWGVATHGQIKSVVMETPINWGGITDKTQNWNEKNMFNPDSFTLETIRKNDVCYYVLDGKVRFIESGLISQQETIPTLMTNYCTVKAENFYCTSDVTEVETKLSSLGVALNMNNKMFVGASTYVSTNVTQVYGNFTFKSSSEDVASVDATGKITALKPGKTTITAFVSEESQAYSEEITVVDPAAVAINFKPDTAVYVHADGWDYSGLINDDPSISIVNTNKRFETPAVALFNVEPSTTWYAEARFTDATGTWAWNSMAIGNRFSNVTNAASVMTFRSYGFGTYQDGCASCIVTDPFDGAYGNWGEQNKAVVADKTNFVLQTYRNGDSTKYYLDGTFVYEDKVDAIGAETLTIPAIFSINNNNLLVKDFYGTNNAEAIATAVAKLK